MKTRSYLLLLAAAGAVLAATVDFNAEGKRWWSHIEFLASDDLQGRDTGSEGHLKAARYLAGEYERYSEIAERLHDGRTEIADRLRHQSDAPALSAARLDVEHMVDERPSGKGHERLRHSQGERAHALSMARGEHHCRPRQSDHAEICRAERGR